MKEPLVSVVTPVYNGERYLAECIESVLKQTYQHWEYIIVNNCSADHTLDIANEFCTKDSRVRVYNSKEFRGIMENWNHALKQISPESKYCKVVHADDLLYPECIERMVQVMENNPSVGIVSSYRLCGEQVDCNGLSFTTKVLSGREVCRSTFYKKYYLFGSPSTILMRSDSIRKRENFYNEDNYHADVEACFDVLQDSNFGFVHQILSYTRLHEETQSATRSQKLKTNLVENSLGVLKKYGPVYLQEREYEDLMEKKLQRYYQVLAVCALKLENKDFWNYHKKSLAKIDMSFSNYRLIKAVLAKLLDLLLHPVETYKSAFKRISK